jgi:hypothetical protein
MVLVPVNTSGDETMMQGVMRRLKELADGDEHGVKNLVKIYEGK